MGESNGPWGQLADNNADAASSWDSYQPLPAPGENPILDGFCRRKNISINALVRMGTRLAEDHVLCYAYENALKYRDMNDGRMWSSWEAEFPAMKIVWQGAEPTESILVVEGETDGARCTEAYDCDVAIMPAGALQVTYPFIEQIRDYRIIMLGLDDDDAGNEGIAKWQGQLPQAVVLRPGNGDWCDTPDADLPPLITEAPAPPPSLLVNAADLMVLQVPDIASYFENAMLPVGGSCVFHGWSKALKSFASMDMMACLATGSEWAGFTNMEEPVHVAVLQYEIPWAYYQQRVGAMREVADQRGVLDEFDQHYHAYSPMVRPQLIAGNTKQEDEVLRELVAGGIQVFLADPIRRMAGGADLNSEKDVRVILGFFERINDLGITVVYTHHDNKTGAAPGASEGAAAMTGSGAFSGDPDTIVNLTLPRGEQWESSKIRNLSFLLRNAPSPGMKGMAIHDNGSLTYQEQPYGYETEPTEAAATEDETAPSL